MTQFQYHPRKLEDAVKSAVEMHRLICTPTPRDSRVWLDAFLRRLDESSPPEYPDIAASLRLGQLRLLAKMLGRLHRKPVFSKLVALLSIRPEKAVCGALWGLLGRYCDEPGIMRLLSNLAQDASWAALSPDELPELPTPLQSAAHVAAHLADQYESGGGEWTGTVESWRALSPETAPARWEDLPLGRRCLRGMLMTPQSRLFRAETPTHLRRWIEAILVKLDEVRAFAGRYLETIAAQSWNDAIVDIVVHRLGDPRLKPERWEGFSERVVQAIIRRINLGKLDEFFARAAGDEERFEFWKQFAEFMGPRSEGRIREGQGFFEFPGFGVIEFMEVGNAAYFYALATYYRYLERGPVSNSQLKDRGAAVHLVTHRGSWAMRHTPIVWGLIKAGESLRGGA